VEVVLDDGASDVVDDDDDVVEANPDDCDSLTFELHPASSMRAAAADVIRLMVTRSDEPG
jgi:hypothetical protein